MANVLMVDDERSLRRTLSEFLRGDGHDVREAEDAPQALDQLRQGGFDVVVTDIILPRMNGVELLQAIRALAPAVPVVMMTGEPTIETASASLRAGAFDYLFKPVSKAAILRAVRNAAEVKALRDAQQRLAADNRNYQQNLERLVEERTRSLRELSSQLLRMQDAERRRIARDLHDTTAQNLAALAMNLSRLERMVPPGDPQLGRLLAESQTLTQRSAHEIRTLSYLLHPPLLDEFGLVRAIRDYVDGFAERSGLRIELDLPAHLERLPEDIELTLFRILQESLGNVHRHSGSPLASIRLTRDAHRVCLEIRDEGRGLPPTAQSNGDAPPGQTGVGIPGMRERLRHLNGHLELASGLPGVCVRATLPLASPP